MNKGMDVGRLDAIYLMKKLEEILPELNSEFAPQFKKFVVARHHWSILWQAAIRIDGYKNFVAYCKHFEMKKEILTKVGELSSYLTNNHRYGICRKSYVLGYVKVVY